MKAILCAAMLALGGAGAADASVIFTFSNVTFVTPSGVPAGTLTGTFTTNNTFTSILSYDITASASGSFAGFEYTGSDSTVTVPFLPQFFQLDSTNNIDELRIYFTSGLTASGGTIAPNFSYESEPSGGNRAPSGTVIPATSGVPEPASWALMIAGFGAMGTALRQRGRRTGLQTG